MDHALEWRSRRSFQYFLTDFEVEIESAVINNYSANFEDYLNEYITLYGTQYIKTYSCIIANISNYAKDNIASAAVLLNLTPFILVSLGSNITELVLIASNVQFWQYC